MKVTLTIWEAAEYSNIGINKIDSLLRTPNCPFVLYVGTKKLVKRKEFEQFISQKLIIYPCAIEKIPSMRYNFERYKQYHCTKCNKENEIYMKLGIGTRCPNFIDKRTPISSHKSPYSNGFSNCTVYKASYTFIRLNATVV